MTKGRRPPMPKGVPSDACPWCGDKPTEKRRRWHPECVTAYRVACFSDDQRRALWKRDHGVCAVCGTDTGSVLLSWRATRRAAFLRPGDFERLTACPVVDWKSWYTPVERQTLEWAADHIKPLWSRPAVVPLADRASWWGMENLQTLCDPCHKAKTRAEAGLRAGKPQLDLAARP